MTREKPDRAKKRWKPAAQATESAHEKYDTPSLTRNEYACTLIVRAKAASPLP
jgi:hypothetical protein